MSWLAQQLSCSETSVAMFLGKKSMDTGLLFTISEVIGVDFFRYYSEEIKSLKGAE